MYPDQLLLRPVVAVSDGATPADQLPLRPSVAASPVVAASNGATFAFCEAEGALLGLSFAAVSSARNGGGVTDWIPLSIIAFHFGYSGDSSGGAVGIP